MEGTPLGRIDTTSVNASQNISNAKLGARLVEIVGMCIYSGKWGYRDNIGNVKGYIWKKCWANTEQD